MTIINAIGRITKDFELRTSEKSGCIYANFSLAVNDGFGNNQKTLFYDCTVFGADAERLVKAKAGKGSLINITGKFSVSEFTRQATGETGYSLKITVLSWSYIPGANGNKKDSDAQNGNSSEGASENNGSGNKNTPVPNEIPDEYPSMDDYNSMTNLDDEGQAF
jgi:single-strand DNA-binding protein